MKKADKAAKWREIRASNTPPSVLVGWTEEDEAELERMANNEIDMSDTYLGRYAAMQKKNAVAAVLDFTDEEWESLKKLKEDDMMRGTANWGEINEKRCKPIILKSNTFIMCGKYDTTVIIVVGLPNQAHLR